jgi:hypothetical protein
LLGVIRKLLFLTFESAMGILRSIDAAVSPCAIFPFHIQKPPSFAYLVQSQKDTAGRKNAALPHSFKDPKMICLFFIANRRFYSTLLPEAQKAIRLSGRQHKRLAVNKPHRNLTSPRISASRPH